MLYKCYLINQLTNFRSTERQEDNNICGRLEHAEAGHVRKPAAHRAAASVSGLWRVVRPRQDVLEGKYHSHVYHICFHFVNVLLISVHSRRDDLRGLRATWWRQKSRHASLHKTFLHVLPARAQRPKPQIYFLGK